jgi:hypothetical protein
VKRAQASAEQARLDAQAAGVLDESVKKARYELAKMLQQGFRDEELRGYMQRFATGAMLLPDTQPPDSETTEQ